MFMNKYLVFGLVLLFGFSAHAGDVKLTFDPSPDARVEGYIFEVYKEGALFLRHDLGTNIEYLMNANIFQPGVEHEANVYAYSESLGMRSESVSENYTAGSWTKPDELIPTDVYILGSPINIIINTQ
jgi:hypothetical protein